MAKTTTQDRAVAALARAVQACGGQSHLARELSRRLGKPVRQGTIWVWLTKSRRVPAEVAPHIEHITAAKGSLVRREDLCPDFPWDMPRARVQRRAAG